MEGCLCQYDNKTKIRMCMGIVGDFSGWLRIEGRSETEPRVKEIVLRDGNLPSDPCH